MQSLLTVSGTHTFSHTAHCLYVPLETRGYPNQPVIRKRHRRHSQKRYRVTGISPGKTSPPPVFGANNQICPQCVSLHIANDLQQMRIMLNRKCLETPLPHMTAFSFHKKRGTFRYPC